MNFLFVIWLGCCLVGAVVGWLISGTPFSFSNAGLWAGMWLGALVARFFDAWRWDHFTTWLRGDHRREMGGFAAVGPLAQVVHKLQRRFKSLEQERDASGQRLQEFLGAIQVSPNGVTLLDADGRIEWCNVTASQQFGLNPERDMAQIVGNLIRDPAFNAYIRGDDFSQEVVLELRQQQKVAVQLHRHAQGRMLMLSRDVTAIEQAAQMRRDFVANVSHEIRTPLTVLSGFIETLQDVPLGTDERQRFLGLMAQQSKRMEALVSDLLALSRLETLPVAPTDTKVSVPDLVEQVEQVVRPALGFGAELKVSFDAPHSLQLLAVESEVVSALTNLVTNAIRYSPADAQTELVCQIVANGDCHMRVIDQGSGIEQQHIARLTERFYRVDRGRSRDTGGTGLGLAIVKHVMQRHGGHLSIESAVGSGSQFTLVWPASRVLT